MYQKFPRLFALCVNQYSGSIGTKILSITSQVLIVFIPIRCKNILKLLYGLTVGPYVFSIYE